MTQAPVPYAATTFQPTTPAVGFGQAISLAFKNYVNFGGISGRGEYWWFVLFAALAGLGTAIVDGFAGSVGIIGVTIPASRELSLLASASHPHCSQVAFRERS